MKPKENILIDHLFWDVVIENLDLKRDRNFIIERVLSYGLGDDKILQELEKVYSISKIKQIALKSTNIFGNELIELLAKRYNLNVEEFQRYYKF